MTYSVPNFDLDSITPCETAWAGCGRLGGRGRHGLGDATADISVLLSNRNEAPTANAGRRTRAC